jgi:hypothetical protein
LKDGTGRALVRAALRRMEAMSDRMIDVHNLVKILHHALAQTQVLNVLDKWLTYIGLVYWELCGNE